MSDKKPKEMKTTRVTFEEFTDYTFNPPATWFIRDATGEYTFVHTSSRAQAQAWVNENYGKGRYTIIAAKLQKEKPKSESGGYSCIGVGSRKK